jgi:D-3-phosphoglycerate dehydrogenase/(S)-sulfolactate dehydrogenase
MNAAPASDVVVVEDVWGEPFEALARDHRVRRSPDAWRDPAQVRAEAGTARALVVRNRTHVDAALLDAAPRLEVVGRAGVGLDNIDVAAADERGVVVVAPFGANATSVAEHTLALALALMRELTEHDRAVRAGEWTRRPGRDLAGRTWGLLGAGATGKAVARLAMAFGMRVIGYDPYIPAETARAAGIDMTDMAQLLAESDVVSVHLPATPETRGLLGSAAFAAMRRGCLLVSVGRGEVIDEGALAAALREGIIGGAGLDVRTQEPPVPGPLDDAPHVVFTPHVAGITVESQHRIATILTSDIRAVLNGDAAAHPAGAHLRPARPPTRGGPL